MLKNRILLRFLSCIFACGLFTFGDITSAMAVSCDSDEDGIVVYVDNSDGGYFSVSFSYGTVNGIGICSIDAGSSYGELGTPDTGSGNGRTKKNCWCLITDIDGTSNSSPNAVFLETFGSLGSCRSSCSQTCADALAWDGGIRATIYSDPDIGGMCEGQPWGGPCNTEISLVTLDPDICDEGVDADSVDGQDWTVTLGPDSETLSGFGACFDVGGNPGEVSQTQPSSETGSECWCGIGAYNDGNTTYTSGMISWFYVGDNWGDPSSCAADCPQACVEKMKEGLCNWVENADELSICIYEEPSAYSVSYDCGYNGSGSPSDSSSYSYGDIVYTQSSGACTPSPGYEFSYWDCNTGTYITPGDSFTIYDNTTCTAYYDQSTYSVSYSCGSNGSGSPSDSQGPYTYGDSATALGANSCTADSNYRFSHWECTDPSPFSGGSMNLDAGDSFTIYGATSCTAQYVPEYTLSYSCNGGTGTVPTSQNLINNESFTTRANTCSKTGYSFAGWTYNSDGSGTVLGANTSATYSFSQNKTLYAKWTTITYPFSVTTTSLSSGATFTFDISASGTFYVNCGSGGTLSGTGVSGNTITKAGTTVETYTCTYSGSTATRTIQFGGAATGYYDTGNTIYPAISFQGNTKVASVTGNLSTIFYDLGSNSGQIPRFNGTFAECTNLRTVPNTLFASLTRSTSSMFASTFYNCTNFDTIPSGLFPFNNGNGVSGAEGMFETTFAGTNIQSIPSGLFSQITSGAQSMFAETFANCTNLDTVPSGLFYFGGTAMSGQYTMFNGTFTGCTSLETLPANLFPVLTGGAVSMFIETFSGCTSLESLPSGLFPFSGNNVSGDEYMFTRTFEGCTDLKSIPADLFSFGNHNVSGAESMFLETFKGCTGLGTASNIQNPIPSNLFSHVTSGAYGLFSGTFTNCSGLTSLPSGLFSSITTASNYMFQSTFEGCSNLTGYIPSNFFAGLVNTQNPSQSPNATGMMADMFKSTGGLATTCPTGTQTYTTGYESYWTDSTNNINSPNHYVACEAQSLFTITYYDTDCSTVLTGMTVPTYTTSDNVTLPTPTKPGYTFNTANDKKWCTACGSGCGVGGWNAGTQTGNKNLYVAQWVGNNITVNFDSDANSCNYGGTLNVPTPSSRTGYVFTGWKQCRLNDFSANASTNGTDYGYLDGNGLSSYHTDVYNLTQRGTWATAFSYATFWGEARCSSTPGASQGATGTPSATSGEHCWCGITRYEVPGLQSACSLSSVKWLYNADAGTHEDCTNACASACGNLFQTSSTVRAAAFGQ